MDLTPGQQRAVEHRGSSALVAASAGSGKTRVLACRCVALIADAAHPCQIDQLLVVTFTRAAAAELRTRVGQMLREETVKTRDPRRRDHLRRQEVLIDAADIGTIDAWCGRIVREHFAATPTGIDPNFTVLGEEQAALLRSQVLDELFEWVYTADDELAERARGWILRNARPGDEFLRGLVHELNRYRERLVNPDQWFEHQLDRCRRGKAEVHADAQRMLAEALAAECGFQHEQLGDLLVGVESPMVREQLGAYRDALAAWRAQLGDAAAVAAVVGDVAAFKFGRKPRDVEGAAGVLREEVKRRWFDKRLKRVWSPERVDAVLADTGRTAELLLTVLQLEQRFGDRLNATKRVRGAYEFGDVLRMALDLLGTPTGTTRRAPTAIARALQRRYAHILVDEYQDTSPVQVELLRLVTRSGPGQSNRFVVGDVKQSIYGFREAEPRLFGELARAFAHGDEDGCVLPLSDNFRSHPDLVAGANRLFEVLFDPKLGGTRYGDDERLRAQREEVSNPTLDGEPRLEVDLVFEDEAAPEESNEETETADEIRLERIEREAQIAARHIRTLLDGQVQIPDRDPGGELRLRPLRPVDIVILLRSAKGNAPRLAGALRQAGIPCVALGRESVLDCLEVQDVHNALALLANRQQDVPLAAYLRGPMVDLSATQLLEVRRAEPAGGFYAAVEAYRARGTDRALVAQLDNAMEQLDGWATAARAQELPVLLQQIVRDTRLVHFAHGLAGGEHRVAMLRALETLAADFAAAGQHGVAEFVEYLDALAEEDLRPSAAATSGEGVVRIMTIHAAKGLEFPVVFLLGTGAAFSRRPQRGSLRCETECGAGLQFFDYPARRKLVSAAFVVNQQAERQSELEEELCLLYVAATRARERLVIIGHTSAETWAGWRQRYAESDGTLPLISRLSARSMLEWVMMGVAAGGLCRPRQGKPALARVATDARDSSPSQSPEPGRGDAAASRATELTPEDRAWVERGRAWLEAPFDTSLARRPAVLSVSAVKQQMNRTSAEDVPRSLDVSAPLRTPCFERAASEEDGLSVGNAYHRFLQQADLTRLASVPDVRAQVTQLVNDRRLSPQDARLLSPDDFCWLARTAEGRRLAQQADRCRREVPFVYALALPDAPERTVLRGVIDCLVELDDGLTLFDYKTDRGLTAEAWETRVRGYSVQLQLYALAAAEIFANRITRSALIFLREHRVIPVAIKASALEAVLTQVASL
jgi:ATP-dependent helicase/nuclease subunit A